MRIQKEKQTLPPQSDSKGDVKYEMRISPSQQQYFFFTAVFMVNGSTNVKQGEDQHPHYLHQPLNQPNKHIISRGLVTSPLALPSKACHPYNPSIWTFWSG